MILSLTVTNIMEVILKTTVTDQIIISAGTAVLKEILKILIFWSCVTDRSVIFWQYCFYHRGLRCFLLVMSVQEPKKEITMHTVMIMNLHGSTGIPVKAKMPFLNIPVHLSIYARSTLFSDVNGIFRDAAFLEKKSVISCGSDLMEPR